MADDLLVRDLGTDLLFDLRPVQIGGFVLSGRAARPAPRSERPTLNGWVQAMQFAVSAVETSPYWVGDLMAYAEDRGDWQEKFSQALSVTGYRPHTLHNLTTISRRVEAPEREIAPSIGHAAAVTKFTRPEQTELLIEARDGHMTVSEFRTHVKQKARRKVIEGQAVLAGMYRVIYADPPWVYGNKPPSGSGAQSHYDGLPIDRLCALPVAAHAMQDAVLFLWTTAPMLYEAPGPREVMLAWGFKPKTGIVWDKVDHGFGNYVSVRHEHLLIGTRGSCVPDRKEPMIDSVQVERQDGPHSSKPASFRQLIERLYDGPYLELFARERVEGWDCFGNDAALWHAEVAV